MDLNKLSGRKFTPEAKEASQEPAIIPKDKQVVKRVFKLAGTTFTSYPFETLHRQQPVSLVLDPMGENTQVHLDPTAIAVFDTNNNHIAYIPKDQSKHIYPLLKANTLRATAVIFDVKGGGDYNWGIEIHVSFEEL